MMRITAVFLTVLQMVHIRRDLLLKLLRPWIISDKKGSLEGYSYLCQGSITVDDHTIQCYNGEVHGQEDFYSAFAHSCNCAFADMGLNLGAGSLRSTAEDLLF